MVEVHEDRQLGDEDLFHLTAVHSILHGGTVYAVDPELVSAEAPLAAVFGY